LEGIQAVDRAEKQGAQTVNSPCRKVNSGYTEVEKMPFLGNRDTFPENKKFSSGSWSAGGKR
jgi:hypothetical protein